MTQQEIIVSLKYAKTDLDDATYDSPRWHALADYIFRLVDELEFEQAKRGELTEGPV